ncbi:single-stranded DNA-binding protein [Candidatus Kaiserbacteria bacterium RIFOXYD1_FULL_42_15]|uniref:Single-stranded DNA-binding protein n=1 Tax=Candidatus Kaiserbacteria bacterium RIFOXYD1_FULL_42_15 TaxID=1798532 RepID=A0A1F6FPP8_9BACT|nr:MAG: single-stranded DNA-binding protein [Candidatus Kaiserbacteria bacterium RIFOXYD1_FULL_42_15]
MYLNKAMVYGNLTRDPEKRVLPNGSTVCSFSVATNRTYNDKDGKKQEQTEYHNIVAFGKLADILSQWLKKGRPVFIEGRMQTSSWEKDNVKHYRTEIIADNFQFGDGGGNSGAGASATPASTSSKTENSGGAPVLPDYPQEDINPEDIPF